MNDEKKVVFNDSIEIEKPKYITLKERLKDFNGHYEFEEWDTGKDVGNEVIE